jgi:septum formation protein
MKVILASTSKYRSEQLSRVIKEFGNYSPNIIEDDYKKSISCPTELAKTLATLKAKDALGAYPNDLIIGGDQVLAFNGQIFSKPKTKERAIEQLLLLSGNTHELITATSYVIGDKCTETVVTAKMKMRKLSKDQIENYIETDMPLNCCGSYMLENSGIGLFEEINCSDYTSIIGLPLMTTTTILLEHGIKVF